MNPQTCPNCDAIIPVRGSYCPVCGQQARCKLCRELLERSACACVECGALVESGHPSHPMGITTSETINTIKFNETKNSRAFEARLTDNAIFSLSNPLGFIFAGRGQDHSAMFSRSGVVNPSTQMALPLEREITSSISQEPNEGSTRDFPQTDEVSHNSHPITHVFLCVAGKVILDDPRLKATSQLDAGRRLTILYLLAIEHNGLAVSRSQLDQFLKNEKLYTSDLAKWINNSADFHCDETCVRLRATGKKVAETYLKEIQDPSIPNSYELGSGPRKSLTPATSPSGTNPVAHSEGKKKASPGRSKTVEKWVAAWNAQAGS